MTEVIWTPLLDEIAISDWFHHKYSPLEEVEVENLIEQHVWITRDKRKIPVREMSISHIKNTIKCWNGKGRSIIPSGYLGGKEKWIKIFNQELLNRQ